MRFAESAGRTARNGRLHLTPITKSWQLKRPFFTLTWQRPTQLIVEQNGHIAVHPIQDITRLIQISSWSLSALLLIGNLYFAVRKRRKYYDPANPRANS